MSYKVSFNMPIEVEGFHDEEGSDLTDEQLKHALQKMIDWIDANPGRASMLVGKVLFSEVEDRWVLRSIHNPKMARKADAGWVDSREISLTDTLTTAQASKLSLFYSKRGFWGKLEDMRSKPVFATLRSDDDYIEEKVDLAEWLATTDESWILALAENDWGECEAYGEAVRFILDENQPSAVKLFTYMDANDPMGMSLTFDSPVHVMFFLEECRPELHQKILDQNCPSL